MDIERCIVSYILLRRNNLIDIKPQEPGLKLALEIFTNNIIELVFEEEDGTHES